MLTTYLPSPTDYGAYARAIASFPPLSEKEETSLALLWRNEGSHDAAKQLVLSQLKLVLKIVKDHEGYGLNRADLVQEGTVGLMKAVHKFDPHKGVRLATYAWYWIEAEVKEFILKNWRIVGWGTSSLAKKMFFGYRKTVQELRRLGENRTPPSIEEIAAALDIKQEDALLAQSYFLGGDIEMDYEDGEEKSIPSLMLTSSASDSVNSFDPVNNMESWDDQRRWGWVKNALVTLPDREQDIVKGRFLTDPPLSLKELAQKHDVSLERVRQLERQALEKIKTQVPAE